MNNPKMLTVFYSRSANTKTVAEAIAKLTGSDIEEVKDTKNRQGFMGFLISAFEGWLKRQTPIKEITKNPAAYDLVIIGTPIWVGSVSSPIRTYLIQNRQRFRNVAFFCTWRGGGSIRAYGQMTDLVEQGPDWDTGYPGNGDGWGRLHAKSRKIYQRIEKQRNDPL